MKHFKLITNSLLLIILVGVLLLPAVSSGMLRVKQQPSNSVLSSQSQRLIEDTQRIKNPPLVDPSYRTNTIAPEPEYLDQITVEESSDTPETTETLTEPLEEQ
jgi:hypothetical protein